MNGPPWLAALLAAAIVQHASPVMAQAEREPIGRIEVGAGPWWTGAASVGAADATITAADRSRLRLFSTASELASASGLELRVGARVTRSIEAGVDASYAVPRLVTTITADIENAAAATASEPIRQLAIEGTALVYLPRSFGPRLAPFVTAGGGYLRELHDGDSFIRTGRVYHVGGGVKVALLTRAGVGKSLKQVGVRADVRAQVRSAGVTLDNRLHTAPAFTGSVFARFF